MGIVAAQAINLATRAVRALEGIDKSLKVLARTSELQGQQIAAWSAQKKGRI